MGAPFLRSSTASVASPSHACLMNRTAHAGPRAGAWPATSTPRSMPNLPRRRSVSVHSTDLLLGDMIARPHEALGLTLPIWAQLGVLVAANILGFQLVQRVLRTMQDKSEPLSVIKLQLGVRGHTDLQRKLERLSGMMQLGQQGSWLILEESILEITRYKNECAYAAVSLTPMKSKSEAYALFGELADSNRGQALAEEEQAEAEEEQSAGGGGGGLFGGLFGGKKQSDEALVVTLLVACRGTLDIPPRASSWSDVQHSLQQLCSLSSDRLMAIELLWTPRDEGRFLTPDQLLRDYPDLRAIGQPDPRAQMASGIDVMRRF